jgi:hypothetical protein
MSKAKWSGECERLAVGSRWSERSTGSRSGGMRRSGESATFRQRGQRREREPVRYSRGCTAVAAIARAAVGDALATDRNALLMARAAINEAGDEQRRHGALIKMQRETSTSMSQGCPSGYSMAGRRRWTRRSNS